MLRIVYLATGAVVILLYVLTEANGWDPLGSGGGSQPAHSGPAGSGGRQSSGYHSWGIGGGFGGGFGGGK